MIRATSRLLLGCAPNDPRDFTEIVASRPHDPRNFTVVAGLRPHDPRNFTVVVVSAHVLTTTTVKSRGSWAFFGR
jgi:hypothetical protein